MSLSLTKLKKTGKERGCDAERSGPAERMDRWIDGQSREKRLTGGRERRGAGKIRRGNGTKESHGQRWLQFVLLITHHMVKDNMRSSKKLCQAVDGARKDGM